MSMFTYPAVGYWLFLLVSMKTLEVSHIKRCVLFDYLATIISFAHRKDTFCPLLPVCPVLGAWKWSSLGVD